MSYSEIEQSEVIDPIVKMEFINDLLGFYITFVEARGGEFLLSDIYPTLEIFPTVVANIHMHCLLPLSPTRMLLLNHIMFKNETIGNPLFSKMVMLSQIKGEAISTPKNRYKIYGSMSPDDEFIYKVNKIYSNDVQYINALVLNETRVGVMFKDIDRIIDSVKVFNKRNDTKQTFIEFENQLNLEKENDSKKGLQ